MRKYSTFRVYVPQWRMERVMGHFSNLIIWQVVSFFTLCHDKPGMTGFEVVVRNQMTFNDFRNVTVYFLPINSLIYPWL